MSRGDRAVASGILSLSMRDNYGEHGVDEVKLDPRWRTSETNTNEVLQKSGSNLPQSTLSWSKTLHVLLAQQVCCDLTFSTIGF